MSRGDLLLLLAVLAAFGAMDSAYLTWEWYAGASASWCDVNAFLSCTRVRESPFSSLGGVPTAAIGLVGFLAVLGVAVQGLRGASRVGPWSVEGVLVVLTAVGLAVGAGLTVIEVFVIQAICILCLFAFLVGVGSFALSAVIHRQSASRSE